MVYDNKFITFPADLRPIRDREDMDAVWEDIEQSLKDMFPAREKEEPVAPPPTDWSKYLKIAGVIIVFLVAFFVIKGFIGEEDRKVEGTKVVADFTVNPTACQVPCEVQFENTSQNADGYRWDFGDGTTSSSAKPSAHTYNESGNFTVELTALKDDGQKVKRRILKIGKSEAFFYFEQWDETSLGPNGWQGTTSRTDVTPKRSGGHPGGFLTSHGEASGTWDIGIVYGNSDIEGNYRQKEITKVTFDLKLIKGNFNNARFRVRYKDSSHNGWFFPIPIYLSSRSWHNYEVSFDPHWTDSRAQTAGWIKEDRSASFKETMANVHQPGFRISGNGYLEAGFDNVRFE